MSTMMGTNGSLPFGNSSSDEPDDPMEISRGSDTNKEDDETSNNNNNNNVLSSVIDKLSRIQSQVRMNQSIAERNAIDEEIHGVRCMAPEETPELIQESLQKFRKELNAVKSGKRDIYDRIVKSVQNRRRLEQQRQTHSPQFQQQRHHSTPTKHYAIEDDDFRIRFLRCELFHIPKAVERFLNYLNLVHKLWGFDIVSRRLIVQSDFTKSEIKHLRKGYLQLLPFRDRSGRRVVVLLGNPSDRDEVSRNTWTKCYLYILDIASRDCVESQRNGVVWLSDPNGMIVQTKNRFPTFSPRVVPTRITAGHHYLPDSMTYRVLETYVLALHTSGSISGVIRHKFYTGYTKLEMEYRLLGYGIPIQYMPWTDTGKIKLKYWKSWIKLRTKIESGAKEDLGVVECPGTSDVVFRHGQPYKKIHGNDILRELIESELVCRKMSVSSLSPPHQSQDLHGSSIGSISMNNNNNNRSSIDQFCDRLIHEIEVNQKGRFLKWDNQLSAWVKMKDAHEIKKKVSASFYNYSKRNYDSLFQEEQNLSNTSSTNNTEDGDPYKFIEGGKDTTDMCSTARTFDHSPTNSTTGNMRKKPRSEFLNR